MDALTYFPRLVNTTSTNVQSFCGLVQQFEAFSADITELMKPINDLISTKSVFSWLPAKVGTFKRIIIEQQSPRVFVQYRPVARLTRETDAAQKTGMGYALWQDEPDRMKRGSRTVSDAETRYSVTKSELNAVFIACML